ncbi:serine/threonine-protein phosphatase 6 regulatory ankyrin repeat subunit B-like, partial [Sitodiplosis mosellana]|uniref:serine/threonine-protein phosphatase 6 regulatory ankyrin repeat subunit B-like n=1 Tax=Sitodiplosis mosellana TaxID=263140 RepID=UPI002444079B
MNLATSSLLLTIGFGVAVIGSFADSPSTNCGSIRGILMGSILVGNEGEYCSNINAQDEYGRTAIFIAATRGNKDSVVKLAEKGADVNIQNNNGFTPLYNAVMQGHENVVEELLKRNAEIDRPEYTGRTPLHIAVIMNRSKLAQKLIANGSNVNAQDMFKRTPIWHTVYLNSQTDAFKMVEVLMVNGTADADIPDKYGITPLLCAVKY